MYKINSKRKSGFFNQKIFLFLLFTFLFIISLALGITLGVNQKTRKEVNNQPFSTTNSKTKLVIYPQKKNLKIGETSQIFVKLIDQPVQAIDVVLLYDPTIIRVSRIKNGNIFSQIIRKKIYRDKIVFSAAVSPSKTKKGLSPGTVFSFSITPIKKANPTIIAFDPKKTIAAKDGKNLLGLAIEGKYFIQ